MERRAFVIGSLAALTWPGVCLPRGKIARLGWLSAGRAELDVGLVDAFRRGMTELGYAEGRRFVLEQRYAAGNPKSLPAAAAELAHLRLDAIVASGDQAALAAKAASASMPIVVHVADALGTGLVANLARPGGNITGITDLHADLVPKRLEMLKELVPNLSRAAFLSNPGNPTCVAQASEIRAAAPSFALGVIVAEAATAADLDRIFSSMMRDNVQGLIVCGDRILATHGQRIHELARKARLPAMYANRRFVESGGLMSYGTNLADVYRRLAVYVDRILKGAKPGELPLEQPTQFEVVISLKAAKAIGLAVPRALLARADHVFD